MVGRQHDDQRVGRAGPDPGAAIAAAVSRPTGSSSTAASAPISPSWLAIRPAWTSPPTTTSSPLAKGSARATAA
jgi:hypothetical protein